MILVSDCIKTYDTTVWSIIYVCVSLSNYATRHAHTSLVIFMVVCFWLGVYGRGNVYDIMYLMERLGLGLGVAIITFIISSIVFGCVADEEDMAK